ncbi:MAG TPA: ankyrin repeat domain-containing protein [Bryobacteraceae bacterium]|nr:ankyrin repeat domain-containing protein [Bryobacteraceae bacterium]
MTIRLATCMAALVVCLPAYGANSPVADAAMKGDKASLRTLLDQKADVNAPQADGATAIQWAAYRDDLEMAGLLISAGANVKLANREGATALYLSSIHGNPAMIDKLLNAGADPNERGPEGETPLMLASRAGNLDAIKVLLDHKADINAKDKIRGTTALMWASEQAHPAAVQLLIARGANVSAATEPDTRNSRNNLANTVTQRLNSSFGAVGQAKARAGAAPGSPGPPAAGSVSGGPPKKTPDGEAGGDDVAIFFGPPRKKDGGGLTPLVYAAREDCLECAKILLDAGADVNQRTHYGWTALLTATQNRHYKLAAYLLDHGANPNIANNGGWSPLYLATDNRNIESGDYPVRAPDMDHLDYIKLLIDKGANVNARVCGTESSDKKCVGDSTETRNNFTMQWLFEDGATPFLRAAQSGDIPLMKLLLAHGADPKIFTAHNVTPLAVASGIGWVEGVTFEWSDKETIEAVKMCLDLGIDPNVKDDEGRTSLHGAAHKGRPEVIQLLVDHGAQLDAHDGGSRDSVNGALLGKTWIPLDWARGLVRVGVQSAIPHPEAEKTLVKLMTDRGMPIPPPPASSICLTKGLNGCQ